MKIFCEVSYSKLDQLVTCAASWYSSVFCNEIAQANEEGAQPTIALIGVGITFDYYITLLALLRLHIRILLLSNKNPLVAHQHLLKECSALGCIVDEANIYVIGREEGFRQGPVPLVGLDELHQWSINNSHTGINNAHLGFKVDYEWPLPSVIIHSSGTTGMPKPIVHTNRSLCLIARHYRLYRDFYIQNFQMCAPL
jgi:acyl-CoA synthetase (AMP-forming)/AMP-acid ligase II